MRTFKIYDKNVRLYVSDLGSDTMIRTEYQDGGNWVFICAPSVLLFGDTTKEKIDATFYKAISEINEAIQSTLAPQ